MELYALKDLVYNVINDEEDFAFATSIISQTLKSFALKQNKDKFYILVKEEPNFMDFRELGVYVSGLVELICSQLGVDPPEWVFNSCYFLSEKFCTLGGYDRIPKFLSSNTLGVFAVRNYFTNERGLDNV